MKTENILYNVLTMLGRPPIKNAPLFGQRLAMLRKGKGLTQTKLAKQLHITQKMIDYYERRAVNPSIEFVQSVAEVLDVSVGEILGHQPKRGQLTRHRPGPPSKLAHRLEQLQHLPHKDQEFVVKFLDTILEKAIRT